MLQEKFKAPQGKLWLTGDRFPTLKAFVEGLGVVKVVVGQLVVLGKVGDAGTIAALHKRGGTKGHMIAEKRSAGR